MRYSGIYAIISPSGSRYIGSSNRISTRWTDHYLYGKTIPDSHKLILSKTHKGKIISEDIRQRTSETMKGMNSGSSNPNAKKVRCIDNDKIFGTMKEAKAWARENINPRAHCGQIRAACIGEQEMAYGLKWQYA